VRQEDVDSDYQFKPADCSADTLVRQLGHGHSSISLFRKEIELRLSSAGVCLHAPNIEAIILRGNEHELAGYMLTGREAGMIDFRSAVKAVQHLIEPSDYQHYSKQ
jgi:hypothetical protein